MAEAAAAQDADDEMFYHDLAELGLMDAATASRLSAKLAGIAAAKQQLVVDEKKLKVERRAQAREAEAEKQLAHLHADVDALAKDKAQWDETMKRAEADRIHWAFERAGREVARAQVMEAALAYDGVPTPDGDATEALAAHLGHLQRTQREQRQHRVAYETRLTLGNARREGRWEVLQARLAEQHAARRAAATQHHTKEVERLQQSALQRVVEIQRLEHERGRLAAKEAEWVERAGRKEGIVRKAVCLADAHSVAAVIEACDGFISQAQHARQGASGTLSPPAAQPPAASLSLSPNPQEHSPSPAAPTPSARSFRGEVPSASPPPAAGPAPAPEIAPPDAAAEGWRVGVAYVQPPCEAAADTPTARPLLVAPQAQLPPFEVAVLRYPAAGQQPAPPPAWIDTAPVLVCPSTPGVTLTGTVSATLRGGRCTFSSLTVARAPAGDAGRSAVEVALTVTVCAVPALTVTVAALVVQHIPRVVVTPSWITFEGAPLPHRVHLGGREHVVPPSGSVLRRGATLRCLSPLVACRVVDRFEGRGTPYVWKGCLGARTVLRDGAAAGRPAGPSALLPSAPPPPPAAREPSRALIDGSAVDAADAVEAAVETEARAPLAAEQAAPPAHTEPAVVTASAAGDALLVHPAAGAAKTLLNNFRADRIAVNDAADGGALVACVGGDLGDGGGALRFVLLRLAPHAAGHGVVNAASFPLPGGGADASASAGVVFVGFLPRSRRPVVGLRGSIFAFAAVAVGDGDAFHCLLEAVLHSRTPITAMCCECEATHDDPRGERLLFFTADGGAARWAAHDASTAVPSFTCSSYVVAAAAFPDGGHTALVDAAGLVEEWSRSGRRQQLGTHRDATAVACVDPTITVTLSATHVAVWDVDVAQLMLNVPTTTTAVGPALNAALLSRPGYFAPHLKVYVGGDVSIEIEPHETETLCVQHGHDGAASARALRSNLSPNVEWSAAECQHLSEDVIDEVSSAARCLGFLKANCLHPPTPCTDAGMRAFIIDFIVGCKLSSTPYVDWWQLAPPP